MAKHRVKRYGICHGVNLLQFFVFPIPIPDEIEISTGNELADLAIRSGISHFIGFIIARIVGWNNDRKK